MELLSSCRRLPVPPGRRAVDHAQQRSDRQLAPGLQPRFELAPRPAVHAHLTSLSAFPAADEDRAVHDVEVGLLKRQGFADSESRAPKQHDQRAQPWPSGRSPTARITATISSTVGGSAG